MPPSQLTAKEYKQQQHTGRPAESQTHKQIQLAEMKQNAEIEAKSALTINQKNIKEQLTSKFAECFVFD